jgi:hypothetical protein
MFIVSSQKIIKFPYFSWDDNLIGTLFPLPWYQEVPYPPSTNPDNIPLQPFDSFLYDFLLRTGAIYLITLCLFIVMLWYSVGYYRIQDQKIKQIYNEKFGFFFLNLYRYFWFNLFAFGSIIFLQFFHELFFPQHFIIRYSGGISYQSTEFGSFLNTMILTSFILILFIIYIYSFKFVFPQPTSRNIYKKIVIVIGNSLFYGILSCLVFVSYTFLHSRSIMFTVSRNIYPTHFPLMIIWFLALFSLLSVRMSIKSLTSRNLLNEKDEQRFGS